MEYEKCKGCSNEVLSTMFIKCMDCPTELCFMCIENETCSACTLNFKASLDQEKEPNEEELNELNEDNEEVKKIQCGKCSKYFHTENIQSGKETNFIKCCLKGCKNTMCAMCTMTYYKINTRVTYKPKYVCMNHICKCGKVGKTINDWGKCKICDGKIHFTCQKLKYDNNLKDICEKHIKKCKWCLGHYDEIEENLCSESINTGINHYCCPRCSFRSGVKIYCRSHKSTCKLCFHYYPATQKYSFNCKQDIEMCEDCHDKISSTFFTMLLCNKKLGINIYKDLKVSLFNSLMEKVVIY